MKRLILDLALGGALTLCLLTILKWPLPGKEFLDSYNYLIWATFTAAVFAVISVSLWNVFGTGFARFGRLIDIAGSLTIAHVLAFTVYALTHRHEDLWTALGFGVLFLWVPAVAASAATFTLLILIARTR
jgi:TctA family transporter